MQAGFKSQEATHPLILLGKAMHERLALPLVSCRKLLKDSSSHFGFWLGEELVWTGFGWVLRARGESAAPQRVGSSVLRWRERFAEAAISDPPASWRFSTP